MEKKKDEFYKDLDRSREKKSSCTCLSFAIFFIVVVLAIEVALFWSVKSLRSNPVSTDMISSALTGQGQSLFGKNQTSENSLTVSISQSVLCQKIKETNAGRDVSCLITPSGIELSGKFSYFGFQNTRLTLVPYVEKEKLQFKVTDARVGNFKMPDALGAGAESLINSTMEDQVPELKSMSVKSVELQDGVMVAELEKL